MVSSRNIMEEDSKGAVLVVEDSAVNLAFLTDILEEGGYEVRPAASGLLALASVASEHPDLILLDIMMPEMDGYELCRRLKADERAAAVPVIFLSALEEPIDKIKAFEAGGVDFITKPFQSMEVLARVRTHIDLRRMQTRLEELVDDRTLELKEANLALKKENADRRQAELSLRESEEKYRNLSRQFQTLLDGIPSKITFIDAQRRIIWANRESRDDLATPGRGRRCYLGSSCSESPCADCPVERVFIGGEIVEESFLSSDGRTWGGKAVPLKGPEGEVVSAICIASDITERVRLRAEADRAARLASVGQLAAGMAHEINNPNAFILMNSPIVKEALEDCLPLLDEHYREEGDFPFGGLMYSVMRDQIPIMCDEIFKSARLIKIIVEDLKNFTRHDSSRLSQPMDLNDAVRASVRLLANTVKNSTDHFALRLGEDLPLMMGDLHQVEQVIVNLIANACQSLPERDRSVSVTTGYDGESESLLCIVRDEGEGIAEVNLPRIIEPFFTTKRDRGGTGLGLSVSARIVQDHRGKLNFESGPGRGTTATLDLPALPEERR